jgi:predicted regulator of Ras-like GTPase activity (Roadblock/LC7/MglB family)
MDFMNRGKVSKVYTNLFVNLKKIDGVQTFVLAGRDGYMLGEYQDDDHEALSFMSATILKTVENAGRKLEMENPEQIVVDFKNKKLITVNAGTKAIIAVIARPDAYLDPIINELEKTASRIQAIL